MGAVIALLTVLAAANPAVTLADGDPASDVLTQQSLFLPQDSGIPVAQQTQLAALLQAASRTGYRVKVALIASSADLGSITELWNQPQSYAKFLGQELSLVYRGPLLVVMPRGVGFFHPGATDPRPTEALRGLPEHPGPALGAVALTAVQKLAAASGHPLAIPAPTSATKPASADTSPWIVFAAGVVLIVIAWGASFRANPPHLRRRRSSATS